MFCIVHQSYSRIALYHLTHVKNLDAIIRSGKLVCKNNLSINLAVDISDPEIQLRRSRTVVPCPPGGTLHDYVPFYFAPRSPMLYRIRNGGVPRFHGHQRELIYLVSTVASVKKMGLEYVFTDGHPIMKVSRYFNDLSQLFTNIDWDVMKAVMWADTPDDMDRKRRRQAEFLVKNYVPLQCIQWLAVLDTDMQMEVRNLLSQHQINIQVLVCSNWYY